MPPLSEAQIKEWLEAELGTALVGETLRDQLVDGVILCNLVLKYYPRSVPRINPPSKGAFKMKENIVFFIAALADDVGMRRPRIFEVGDLFDSRNIPKVLDTLSELKVVLEQHKAALARAAAEEQRLALTRTRDERRERRRSGRNYDFIAQKKAASFADKAAADSPAAKAAAESACLAAPPPPPTLAPSVDVLPPEVAAARPLSLAVEEASSWPVSAAAASPPAAADPGALKHKGHQRRRAGSDAHRRHSHHHHNHHHHHAKEDAPDLSVFNAVSSAVALSSSPLGTFRASLRVVEPSSSAHFLRVPDTTLARVRPIIVRLQAVVRGRIARRKYRGLCRALAYRDNIVNEILSTERVYVSKLRALVEVFMQPLKAALKTDAPIIRSEDIRILFGDIEVIFGYNTQLLAKLEERREQWNHRTCLGDIFTQMAAFLKCYTAYVNNYNRALTHRAELARTNSPFAAFVAQAELRTDALGSDTLQSLVIMPVQRIPRYEMLLRDLTKHTAADHADYPALVLAGEKIKEVALYVNERKRIAESIAQVQGIQTSISDCPGLAKPGRLFVSATHAAKVHVYSETGTVAALATYSVPSAVSLAPSSLFLFTDLLVLAEPTSSAAKAMRLLVGTVPVLRTHDDATKAEKPRLKFSGMLKLRATTKVVALEDDFLLIKAADDRELLLVRCESSAAREDLVDDLLDQFDLLSEQIQRPHSQTSFVSDSVVASSNKKKQLKERDKDGADKAPPAEIARPAAPPKRGPDHSIYAPVAAGERGGAAAALRDSESESVDDRAPAVKLPSLTGSVSGTWARDTKLPAPTGGYAVAPPCQQQLARSPPSSPAAELRSSSVSSASAVSNGVSDVGAMLLESAETTLDREAVREAQRKLRAQRALQ